MAHTRAMPAPMPGFDQETGEVCPGCEARDAELRALESEKRVWIARHTRLARDKDKEARRSEFWRPAREVFELWQAMSGKRRARWTTDRFELIKPFLEAEGIGDCKLAVQGLFASEWHVEHGYIDFENVFSPRADRQKRFEAFRDRAIEAYGDAPPFYVGTEPTLFDPDAGLTKRLRERVLALELSGNDRATTTKILAEIHELTKGPLGHDVERD